MFYFVLCFIHLYCFAGDPFLPDAPHEKPIASDEHLIGNLIQPRTGQLSLASTDLIARGAEPLALTRYYYPPKMQDKYSKNKKEDDYAFGRALTQSPGWLFFPHLVASFQRLDRGRAIITITEPDGSLLQFKRHKDQRITLESKGPFTNSDGQILSSTYDSRNTTCSIDSGKIYIHSKDGAVRIYEPHGERYFLKKERLSHGKVIVYSYDDQNFLVSVESKDPKEEHTYAKLIRSGHDWITHTGQKASYQFDVLSKEGRFIKLFPPTYASYDYECHFLTKVLSPLVDESYGYNARGLLCWRSDKFSSTYTPYKGVLRISDLQLPPRLSTHFIEYHTYGTAVTNPDGTKTFYTFSLNHFPKKIEHEGKNTLYHWGNNGYLQAVEIEGLYRKEYESDSYGNSIQETFIGEDSYTIYRDFDRHRLIREEGDAVTTYTYLEGTDLVTSKITEGLEEYYTYDDCNNLIKTVIEGRTTRYVLRQNPPHLHCIDWIEKEDRKIHFHYDQQGNISQEDHYDGESEFVYSIYKEYNERGQVISEINPIGQKFTYTYDKEGRLTSSSKTKETMQYDIKGRLIKYSDALYTTTYEYDTADNLIEKHDRFGSTYYTYHNKNLTKTVHGDQVTISTYDVYGREISRTDNGHTTKFQYNARSKPIRIDYPDGSHESYTYYPNGNLKDHTDPDGNTISYTYDSFGRMLSNTKEGTFVYDALHLLSYTDLEGFTTEYIYDALGRKIREERCERITDYTYDSLSRVASITKGGITTSYTYDLLDRIIEESTPWSKITYTYDEEGNKSSITTGDSTEFFVYDPLKRLIQKIDANGYTTHIEYTDFQTITTDPKGIVTTETYDIYENLISKEIPNVTAFRYTYDLGNNLIHQKEDVYKNGTYLKTLITEYTYTPTNKLASITRSGETTSYTYVPSGKIKTKPDGTCIKYTYDFLGNCIQANSDTFVYNKLGHLIGGTGFVREVDPFGNILKETFSNGLSIEKTYDDLDRPLTVKLPTGTIEYSYNLRLKTISYKGYTHTYTYNLASHIVTSGPTTYARDAKGQILKLENPHTTQECTYDPLGNLIFATPNTYTYDELSQLTTDFDSHFDLDGVSETGNLPTLNNLNLLYDEHDRLIQAGDTHFTYDALGRRLSKNTEYYLYDGLEEVGTASYAKIHNVLLDLKGTLAIPLFDATYTLRYLIDPITHAILNSYEFDPFGNPINISETLENPYRYAFKHYDEETTLIYFGKRYYNPSTRRWITPDPLGPIDTVNLYAFVRNNPFRYTDYVGLFSLSVINNPDLDQQISIELTRMKAPYTRSISFGNLNRWDKKIIHIHGINSPISRTEHCIQTISQYADGLKTTGIYNPTNSLYKDLIEYSIRIQPIQLIHSQVEKELSYQLIMGHLIMPPSAKILLSSYSGGTVEARNTLYFSPPAIRSRVSSITLGPSAIIDKKLSYRSLNYASENDLVAKFAAKMTPDLADQLIYLKPHPTANKWNDHDWDSPTYQPQYQMDITDYLKGRY